ncbi:MAG TPA: TIGR03619 family F420-dependent LLM class oxidoreductase [Acidimicrobiales bacterium]|nr:TIGR03619 family F420-dependent LLM class oxidoreductase [Acidimicrobiales bacterium]
MHVGFTSMNNPDEPRPDVLARELEARGFESLWLGEHSHIPASRRTPYPAGGEMPRRYRSMMDPFLSLLLAAEATERLVVGTGVALPLEHDVFDLAKTVATIDRLTDGRFHFGVGVGWNEEELADHRPSVPWSKRYGALADCVGALKALWTQADAEYHGRWYDFDAVWCEPKPLQQPHPPIVCGTGGRVGTQHAIAWADAWMPMDVALGDVGRKVTKFRAIAAEAGRDPATIAVNLVVFGDPTVDALVAYRDLGIDRVILGSGRTGWDDPSTILPFVDACAALIPEVC